MCGTHHTGHETKRSMKARERERERERVLVLVLVLVYSELAMEKKGYQPRKAGPRRGKMQVTTGSLNRQKTKLVQMLLTGNKQV